MVFFVLRGGVVAGDSVETKGFSLYANQAFFKGYWPDNLWREKEKSTAQGDAFLLSSPSKLGIA
jgi:hypothetical protein